LAANIGLGPPSRRPSALTHTTPTAPPFGNMIGEPDIPPTIGCAASSSHSEPPRLMTRHLNHSPSSDSMRVAGSLTQSAQPLSRETELANRERRRLFGQGVVCLCLLP
jgi:hypothetical protein